MSSENRREDWKLVELGQIAIINPKNESVDDLCVSFVPMKLISDGFTCSHSYEERRWGEVKKGFTHFQEGDIAVAKITPCFENRKSVILKNLINNIGAGTTEIIIIRPKENVYAPYVFWIFKTEAFIKKGVASFSGAVGQQRISSNFVKSYPILLPPYSEQVKIASKIEELFTQLDAAEAALKVAKEQLGRYRQAIINSTFTGKENTLLGEYIRRLKIGPFGSLLHKSDYIPNGIPLVNPMHMQNGKIVADPRYTITKDKAQELSNYLLHENDIVMARRGEIGRCAVVRKEQSGFMCGTGSLIITLQDSVLPDYAYFYIISDHATRYLEANSKGTTFLNLNMSALNNMPFYAPSLHEQKRIIDELEQIITISKHTVLTIDKENERIKKLRQSILRKAFSGTLLKDNI